MKRLARGPATLATLFGAALMVANFACSSSSTGQPASGTGGGGGATATGGKGGATPTGGAGGATADAGVPVLSYTFDSSTQDFMINTYHDTTSTNLGYVLTPDAGLDAANAPTLTWDMTDGSPATPVAGCLKLVATYTGYDQYVDVKLGVSNLNLKGKQLTAQVQLASVTGGAFPGGAILEADTGSSYVYGGSLGSSLPLGTWVPLTLDLDTVTTTGYDDTMVIQVGVQFYSGSAPAAGGAALGPIEATFLIDTIQGG